MPTKHHLSYYYGCLSFINLNNKNLLFNKKIII
jgi:hypothetical protein